MRHDRAKGKAFPLPSVTTAAFFFVVPFRPLAVVGQKEK